SVNADYNGYWPEGKTYIDKMAEKNMKMLMHRPKIEWLCYGQRSDYQAEKKDYVDPYLWFYSFQTNYGRTEQDNSQYGEGQYVLYCSESVIPTDGSNYMSEGTVLSLLRCNNQQTKPDTNWRYDGRSNWFVKPSIRIDPTFANNPSNFGALVCRVDVYNSDGTLRKQIDIRARNFKTHPHPDSLYLGNY